MKTARRCSLVMLACGALRTPPSRRALKDAFADDFRVGAAVGTQQVMGEEPPALELVARQFNTITPENLLKWAEVHPEPDRYNFEPADQLRRLGAKRTACSSSATRSCGTTRRREWAFAGRRRQAARPRDGAAPHRRAHRHGRRPLQGPHQRLGRRQRSDRRQRQAAQRPRRPAGPTRRAVARGHRRRLHREGLPLRPRRRSRRRAVLQRLQRVASGEDRGDLEAGPSLKEKGVRIDGLGLQGHWGMDYPKLEEIDHMLTEYGKLGVKLMITELDINVLPHRDRTRAPTSRANERRKARDPYPDGLPDDQQQALAERYADIFRSSSSTATRSTASRSGASTTATRGSTTGRPRTNYPLLFDRQLQPKPAFDAVIEVAASK